MCYLNTNNMCHSRDRQVLGQKVLMHFKLESVSSWVNLEKTLPTIKEKARKQPLSPWAWWASSCILRASIPPGRHI